MDQSVKGLCPHCHTVVAFAAAQLGVTAPCPVCAVPIRLRAAPDEAVAAAGAGVPVKTATAAPEVGEDVAEQRLKRSLIRLAILTAVSAGVLIGLVITAEWLVRKKKQRDNRKKVELILPAAPSRVAAVRIH